MAIKNYQNQANEFFNLDQELVIAEMLGSSIPVR